MSIANFRHLKTRVKEHLTKFVLNLKKEKTMIKTVRKATKRSSMVNHSISNTDCVNYYTLGHVQNPPAFKTNPIKIHPVNFQNRLPIKGKGYG